MKHAQTHVKCAPACLEHPIFSWILLPGNRHKPRTDKRSAYGSIFSPSRGPQVLVLGSTYQGSILGTYFDPQPSVENHAWVFARNS